jgi:Flp pilus assembly protein TadG
MLMAVLLRSLFSRHIAIVAQRVQDRATHDDKRYRMALLMNRSTPTGHQSSPRPVRRNRGNAVLECALVILPLMAIGFALMDYTIGLFVQNVLRNAVREGCRFAITQQTGAGGQDAAVKSVVQANSMGFLQNTTAVSITYYDSNLNVVTGTGSNAQGNLCLVSIAGFSWTWFAPVMRSSTPLTFSAASSDLMEAPPNGILPTR